MFTPRDTRWLREGLLHSALPAETLRAFLAAIEDRVSHTRRLDALAHEILEEHYWLDDLTRVPVASQRRPNSPEGLAEEIPRRLAAFAHGAPLHPRRTVPVEAAYRTVLAAFTTYWPRRKDRDGARGLLRVARKAYKQISSATAAQRAAALAPHSDLAHELLEARQPAGAARILVARAFDLGPATLRQMIARRARKPLRP